MAEKTPGAHGLVCVPSVAETLSRRGTGGFDSQGDVTTRIKPGPRCSTGSVAFIRRVFSGCIPRRIPSVYLYVCLDVYVGTCRAPDTGSEAEVGVPCRRLSTGLVCGFGGG